MIQMPTMVSHYTLWPYGAQPYTPASAAWESDERAVYIPILLPVACVARRVWWANGATTSGGATVEVGIFWDTGSFTPGTKVTSGSATQGTASQVQFVDITDVSLPPGLWWIAIMATTTSNTTFFRSQVANGSLSADASRRFQQTSANPLPSSATPVESTNANMYLCGFSTTASP